MGGDMLSAMKYISTVPFSGLFNWDVKIILGDNIITSKKHPMKPFSYFTRPANIQKVKIEDEHEYKIIGVRSYGLGAYKNRITKGKYLKMKVYQQAKLNHLFWCKVDTKNGAFGIITQELSDGIASSNMMFAELDLSRINPDYLQLLFRCPKINTYMDSMVTGTTNRKYIRFSDLLNNVKVPVPSLEEQNELVEEYNKAITKIVDKENTINTLKKSIDRYICDVLGYNAIKTNTNKIKRLLSTYHYKDLGRWDIFNLNYEVQSEVYPTTILKDIVVAKPKYGASYKTIHKVSDVRYIRITDINEDGTLNEDIVSADGYDNQYLLQDGDFLIARSGNTVGKTFLYQSDIGKAIYAGYLIKFVLNPDLINPKYLLFYTKSSIYKRWINSNMRVSAQPNINSEQYLFSPIIVPEMEVQDRIVKHIESIIKRIHELAKSSKNDERTALRNFETPIFE